MAALDEPLEDPFDGVLEDFESDDVVLVLVLDESEEPELEASLFDDEPSEDELVVDEELEPRLSFL